MRKMKLQSLLADWEELLTAVRETRHALPHIDPFQIDLRNAVQETRDAKALQKTLRAASQEATHQVIAAVERGSDAACRMRSYLKGCLGVRNEELVRFGVAPLRKRGPRRKA